MILKHHVPSFGSYSQKTIKIRTTLFDLLKVLDEEVRVGEEELVAKIVYYWIESGRLKFISPEDRKAVTHPPVAHQRQEGRMRQPLVEITI